MNHYFELNRISKFYAALCILLSCGLFEITAAVMSTNSTLHFDLNADGSVEMELNSTGLGVGVSPAANLQISGNAVISERLSVGASSIPEIQLYVSGRLGMNHESVSDNTMLSGNSLVLVDTSAGNITIDLPAASTNEGVLYTIKKTSRSNQLHLRSFSGSIEDEHGASLSSGNLSLIKLYSDGEDWHSLSNHDGLASWWTPAQISTKAWYDASDSASFTPSSGNISQWSDKSGNDYHMVQSTSTRQPEAGLHKINGRDSLHFDPNLYKTLDSSPSLTITNEAFYVFVVWQPGVDTGDYQFIYRNTSSVGTGDGKTSLVSRLSSGVRITTYSSGSGDQVTSTTNPTVGEPIMIGHYSSGHGATSAVNINGEEEGSVVNGSTDSSSKFSIGKSSSRPLTGNLGELIHINTAMSALEIQKVEGYLAWKWGLEASLPASHPYKDAAP